MTPSDAAETVPGKPIDFSFCEITHLESKYIFETAIRVKNG